MKETKPVDELLNDLYGNGLDTKIDELGRDLGLIRDSFPDKVRNAWTTCLTKVKETYGAVKNAYR